MIEWLDLSDDYNVLRNVNDYVFLVGEQEPSEVNSYDHPKPFFFIIGDIDSGFELYVDTRQERGIYENTDYSPGVLVDKFSNVEDAKIKAEYFLEKYYLSPFNYMMKEAPIESGEKAQFLNPETPPSHWSYDLSELNKQIISKIKNMIRRCEKLEQNKNYKEADKVMNRIILAAQTIHLPSKNNPFALQVGNQTVNQINNKFIRKHSAEPQYFKDSAGQKYLLLHGINRGNKMFFDVGKESIPEDQLADWMKNKGYSGNTFLISCFGGKFKPVSKGGVNVKSLFTNTGKVKVGLSPDRKSLIFMD